MTLFTEIEKAMLKLICNHKRSETAKVSMSKRPKMEASHFLISKYIIKPQ
jgi:hypothetical protein